MTDAVQQELPTQPQQTPLVDEFFSTLDNVKPYLKIAFEGFAGSGKTLTAAKIAIGLHRRIRSTKPVVIVDTEMAAKFLKPVFDGAGIQAVVKNTRSLADLKTAMAKCRDGFADVMLIDSISHIWENFLEAYKWKTRKDGSRYYVSKLEFQDWGLIKPAWKAEFSDPFVRDPYHTLMTGRAGYEYENEMVDQGEGKPKKREIFKSGIKMKVEGETAYEPDLLVLMERFEEILGDDKKVWREATVIKDRSQLLDGRTFKNPGYEEFAPAIELILKDPSVRDLGPEADAAKLIQQEKDHSDFRKQRDIALEKIEAYMVSVGYAGQTAEAKKNKVAALDYAFGTTSWTEISAFPPVRLTHGLEQLRNYVKAAIAGQAEKLAGDPPPKKNGAKKSDPPAEAAAVVCDVCHRKNGHVPGCPNAPEPPTAEPS